MPVVLNEKEFCSTDVDESYCCIVSSYDTAGDSPIPPFVCPFPYLAFCGPLVPGKYACCCGCSLCDSTRPMCELPCPIICLMWPVVYPIGLVLSILTAGLNYSFKKTPVVYAGGRLFAV